MTDQISALVDGELDPAEAGRLLAGLKSDPALRRTWDEYHCVGDALRGHYGGAVCGAVRERLASEPAIVAPKPSRHHAHPQPWGRWAMSAAAGLAAVALVTWVAFPGLGNRTEVAQAPAQPQAEASASRPLQPSTATPPAPVTPVASGLGAAPQFASATASPAAPAESGDIELGVGNYLLAHQRYSPANVLQGVAPYVRTVSSGGDSR
jgi:sigma-E factor negative regulatory protein RseA